VLTIHMREAGRSATRQHDELVDPASAAPNAATHTNPSHVDFTVV
jgi:hypothetical protein